MLLREWFKVLKTDRASFTQVNCLRFLLFLGNHALLHPVTLSACLSCFRSLTGIEIRSFVFYDFFIGSDFSRQILVVTRTKIAQVFEEGTPNNLISNLI